MRMSLPLVPAALALSLLGSACGGANAVDAASPTGASVQSDIVTTAAANEHLKTLVSAIQAADLAETLKGPGPFTVFAPTDDAFAKLPAGTVEGLMKPENKAKLADVLTYHVVAGRVTSAEASHLSTAKSVEGKELKVAPGGSGLTVNGANVVQADITCSNGVIHLVDAVLLPPQ